MEANTDQTSTETQIFKVYVEQINRGFITRLSSEQRFEKIYQQVSDLFLSSGEFEVEYVALLDKPVSELRYVVPPFLKSEDLSDLSTKEPVYLKAVLQKKVGSAPKSNSAKQRAEKPPVAQTNPVEAESSGSSSSESESEEEAKPTSPQTTTPAKRKHSKMTITKPTEQSEQKKLRQTTLTTPVKKLSTSLKPDPTPLSNPSPGTETSGGSTATESGSESSSSSEVTRALLMPYVKSDLGE